MESKVRETGFRNGGRLGAVKNLGLSLRLPGFNQNAMPGIPEPTSKASEDYQNHLAEMQHLRARVRAEAQRLQFNR